MSIRRWKYAIFALAFAAAAPSCTVDVAPTPAPSDPPVAQAQEGLTLTSQQPTLISGSYAHDGAVLHFTSERAGDATHITLRSGAGSILLDLVDDPATKLQTMSFLDGILKQTISHKLIDIRSAGTSSPSSDDFKSEGDIDAANGLTNSREYQLLPALSRELGSRGLDGRNFPAALTIHVLALRAQQVANQRAAGITMPQGLDLSNGAQCVPITCANGLTACLGGNGCNWAPVNPCPTYYGADLRSNPCNNDCYGMCGPDCTCWDWVCGDCSYHLGCATHDDWCGACTWYEPWNCALCYSPTAIVAVLDCRL